MRWIALVTLIACGKGAAKEQAAPAPSEEVVAAVDETATPPPKRFAQDPDPCKRSCGHWMEPFEIERLDKNGHALSAPPGKHEMYFDTCVQDCRAMPEACRGVPTAKADDPQIDACASALHASRADVSNCLAAKGELGIANCLALWAKAKR